MFTLTPSAPSSRIACGVFERSPVDTPFRYSTEIRLVHDRHPFQVARQDRPAKPRFAFLRELAIVRQPLLDGTRPNPGTNSHFGMYPFHTTIRSPFSSTLSVCYACYLEPLVLWTSWRVVLGVFVSLNPLTKFYDLFIS